MSSSAAGGFAPLVTVVGFHHARGPEVESWYGVEEGRDPAAEYNWTLLPFMALSDGAHISTEDFSYFTLLRPATDAAPAKSLFGISCTRQMDASKLLNRPADVTRSTVQKAVVVIADTPQYFGMLRERLSVVTSAWFAQREFTDTEILKRFQESLCEEVKEEDRDQYIGVNLREWIHEYRWQTLVLFKSALLQPKMLFFGSKCEALCMMQFCLVSLIPGLIRNLQDCADPELNNYEKTLAKPTSLRTSDRTSLLSYMGLPLQIFGKGSLFGPYTPLQQLDILADYGTKSYLVGSTNSLLLQQKDRYSDVLINLDDLNISISSPSLRSALALSAADRRWIDFITQTVNDTWDESNPGRPKTMGYAGSEEFIRMQFEEYLLALLSSVKCHNYMVRYANHPGKMLPHVEGDPSADFNPEWVEAWTKTENYRMWENNTDSHLFDIVEPKHPCAGGLTIDDVQRRLAQQVQDLHLDERFATGKEAFERNLAAGKERATTVFNKLYADMEAFRETQRRKQEEQKALAEKNNTTHTQQSYQPDLTKASAAVASASSKAGAYMSSWASWATEKRKTGWGRGSSSKRSSQASSIEIKPPIVSPPTVQSPTPAVETEKEVRPATKESYKESIFDRDNHDHEVNGGHGVETIEASAVEAATPPQIESASTEPNPWEEPIPVLAEPKTTSTAEKETVAGEVPESKKHLAEAEITDELAASDKEPVTAEEKPAIEQADAAVDTPPVKTTEV